MPTCNRVETHFIKDSNVLDKLSFVSKNLYNQANYRVRQMFIGTSRQKENGLIDHATILGYNELEKQLKGIEEYQVLSGQTRQSILRLLDKNWKSFVALCKLWVKDKSKLTGQPSLPGYLDKQGRFLLIYPGQNIMFDKQGNLKIPKTNLNVKTNVTKDILKEVRIIPLGNKCFNIEIVYQKELVDLNLNKGNAVGIDIGVNNLMSITSNQTDSFSCLVNGRQLKSVNKYYNKQLALQSSILKVVNNKHWSNALNKLTLKRKHKIDDYLHKASHGLIDLCKQFNIGTIIIGHNDNWKQSVNMNKVNNQNFVQIPFNRLIKMIQYKAEEVGIIVQLVEESYTSKCDHLAGEAMEHQESYLGRRVHRGLFKSSTGKILNADINGALGMLRKANVVCKEFLQELVVDRGCVLQPIKLNY